MRKLEPGSPQTTAHVDLQHFTPNHVLTHDIQPCVRSKRGSRRSTFSLEDSTQEPITLWWSQQLPRTSVTAISQTRSFSESRIFKSVKSHKPVSKTYRPENAFFGHITTFSFHFPLTLLVLNTPNDGAEPTYAR